MKALSRRHRRSYDSATLARSKSRRSIPFDSPRPSTHPFKPGDEVIVYRVEAEQRDQRAADVRRFSHLINTDEVFGTHSHAYGLSHQIEA